MQTIVYLGRTWTPGRTRMWAKEGVQCHTCIIDIELHWVITSTTRNGPRRQSGCHRTSVLQQVRTTPLGLLGTVGGGNSRQPSDSSVDNCRRTRFKNCSRRPIEGAKEGIACLRGIPNYSTFSQSIHRGEHGTQVGCGRQAGEGHSRRTLRCRVRLCYHHDWTDVFPSSLGPRSRSCPMTRMAELCTTCIQSAFET